VPAADIIQRMAVPGFDERLFVLGCYARRVTIHSQQQRAFNLIYAIVESAKLARGDRIAIVGGGLGGVTAAAAAAAKGYRTTMFESGNELVPTQLGSTRYVHPNIFDWPGSGWADPWTHLPYLNWRADQITRVRAQLLKEWGDLTQRWAEQYGYRVDVQVERRVRTIERHGAQLVLGMQKSVPVTTFDGVILAIGFGTERGWPNVVGYDYWRENDLHQRRGQRSVFISGTGDGGIIDLLRVRMRTFEQDRLIETYLSGADADALVAQLATVEARLTGSPDNDARVLLDAYSALDVPQALIDRIELRADTTAVLHGRYIGPFDARAALVHRALLLLLWRAHAFEYHSEALTPDAVTGSAREYVVRLPPDDGRPFDEVIIRHGPNASLARDFPAIHASSEPVMRRETYDDPTRICAYPDGYFPPITEAPLPAQPPAPTVLPPQLEWIDLYGGALAKVVEFRLAGAVRTAPLPLTARLLAPEATFAGTSSAIRQHVGPAAFLAFPNWRAVLLHAPGGAGKTVYLLNVAAEALAHAREIPFLLDLRTADFSAFRTADEIPLSVVLDRTSVVAQEQSAARQVSDALAARADVLLLMDGLNEVGDAGEKILRGLSTVLREHTTVRAIVTDRLVARAGGDDFLRATIEPLPEELVRQALGTFGRPALTPDELEMLRLPFFYDLATDLVRRTGTRLQTLTSTLRLVEEFLRTETELSDAEMATVAEAAFDAYAAFGGPAFDRTYWTDRVSRATADKLGAAGVVLPASATAPDTLTFAHQLFHDAFVGRALAAHAAWPPSDLDIATLRARAFEPLVFAAQLLDAHRADAFLEAVYDWNYTAAFHCVRELERGPAPSPFSRALKFALTALYAEKKSDYVLATAVRARTNVDGFDWPEARALRDADTPDELRAAVATAEGVDDTDRFVAWRELFIAADADAAAVLPHIQGSPLVGWTAANVLRRVPMAEHTLARLRRMYIQRSDRRDDTLRWRIVHVLGRYPSRETADVLTSATFSDPYHWARYGALRSLVEAASRATDTALRRAILDTLQARLVELREPILLAELRRSTLVRDPAPGWFRDIRALTVDARKLSTPEEDAAWEQHLNELDAAAAREARQAG
jgi:hypothetical protein